jgi:hypothetical protein
MEERFSFWRIDIKPKQVIHELKQALAFTGCYRYTTDGQKFFVAHIFQHKFATTKAL